MKQSPVILGLSGALRKVSTLGATGYRKELRILLTPDF